MLPLVDIRVVAQSTSLTDDYVTLLSKKMECPVFGIHNSFNEATTPPLQIYFSFVQIPLLKYL
jgi:hypothetical protein